MTDSAQIAANMLRMSGWDGLEGVDQKVEAMLGGLSAEQSAAIEHEAYVVGAALNSGAGDQFLAHLLVKYVMRPPTGEEAAARTAEEVALHAKKREAQADLIWDIIAALKIARGQQEDGET